MKSIENVRIGCAGWTVPAQSSREFGEGVSHLARYATRFSAVEINSSFYRPHRAATYARWAASTPEDFRFAVKVPRLITHELRLHEVEEELQAFLAGPRALGEKLGVLLVQLPPSLSLEPTIVENFFAALRALTTTPVACEPRHKSWYEPQVDALLKQHAVARVAADPACVPAAAEPDGDMSLVYYRLHGSPRIYYSDYDEPYLQNLTAALRVHSASGRNCWCIFDNTAAGAATRNALTLARRPLAERI